MDSSADLQQGSEGRTAQAAEGFGAPRSGPAPAAELADMVVRHESALSEARRDSHRSNTWVRFTLLGLLSVLVLVAAFTVVALR